MHHGATLGDFWTDNHAEAEEAVPVYAAVPENSSEPTGTGRPALTTKLLYLGRRLTT